MAIVGTGHQDKTMNSSAQFHRHPSEVDLVIGRHSTRDARAWHQGPLHYSGQNNGANAFESQAWMPVMAYTGPDFGFDAAHILGQDYMNGGEDFDMGTLFGNLG